MSSHTLSWFNTDTLCIDCSAEESKHPDFAYAKQAERDAVIAGHLMFKGVGWPGVAGRIQR
jgi:hypothetical protein